MYHISLHIQIQQTVSGASWRALALIISMYSARPLMLMNSSTHTPHDPVIHFSTQPIVCECIYSLPLCSHFHSPYVRGERYNIHCIYCIIIQNDDGGGGVLEVVEQRVQPGYACSRASSQVAAPREGPRLACERESPVPCCSYTMYAATHSNYRPKAVDFYRSFVDGPFARHTYMFILYINLLGLNNLLCCLLTSLYIIRLELRCEAVAFLILIIVHTFLWQ